MTLKRPASGDGVIEDTAGEDTVGATRTEDTTVAMDTHTGDERLTLLSTTPTHTSLNDDTFRKRDSIIASSNVFVTVLLLQ